MSVLIISVNVNQILNWIQLIILAFLIFALMITGVRIMIRTEYTLILLVFVIMIKTKILSLKNVSIISISKLQILFLFNSNTDREIMQFERRMGIESILL
jgi:hypothetical protein